jgi:hypothetical protein
MDGEGNDGAAYLVSRDEGLSVEGGDDHALAGAAGAVLIPQPSLGGGSAAAMALRTASISSSRRSSP